VDFTGNIVMCPGDFPFGHLHQVNHLFRPSAQDHSFLGKTDPAAATFKEGNAKFFLQVPHLS
jgi:hypothetical protein